MSEIVSIIIPTFKNHDTLRVAIDSIIYQTYTNLDIIVVDDNPEEDIRTEEIVKNISKYDSRVKYFRNNNIEEKLDKFGVNVDAGYSARNLGISKAVGSWITFQDSDDLSLLNRVEIQLKLAKKYNLLHLTTDCIWFTNQYVGKSLDFEKFRERCQLKLTDSNAIYHQAWNSLGIFGKFLPQKVFDILPFMLKRKKYINRLFYRYEPGYIGAANNPFVKSELAKKVNFRHVDFRKWPSYRGRGADRDFNYNLAFKYKKSGYLGVPLYCWRTPKSFAYKYNINDCLL